ncbi:hypothetical protein AB1Y20_007058 [Prymnesium parvum]|uniref:protein-tyrosine-phosphatase n=1 Tax=Prymnesium parvum TaxID=97485 RepID=A0AB34J3H1_PRYPA
MEDEATALLRSSLRAADHAPDSQSHASAEELVFHVDDRLYLGTEHGAASQAAFDVLRVGLVINLTSGGGKVANHFAAEAKYINYELADHPGENILTRGIREGTQELREWLADGTRTRPAALVHCVAGLSRSATVVVAWMMSSREMSLLEAVTHVTERRGRRLRINPSFWMALALWERELRSLPTGTPPSFDFTPCWVEHFGELGFPRELIEHALVKVGDWVDFESAFEALLMGENA